MRWPRQARDPLIPRPRHGRRLRRQGLEGCPPHLPAGVVVGRRKLDQLNEAVSRESLRFPPGNRWEKLKDERAGQDANPDQRPVPDLLRLDGGRTDASRDH